MRNNNSNTVTINKEAYEAAKAAGLTTATYAQWRAEQKQLAVESGQQVVTMAAPIEQPAVVEPTVSAPVSAPAILQSVVATLDEATIAAATASKSVATSKASIARAIFNTALEEQKKTKVPMVRKTILALFTTPIEKGGAGLTKDGANTYYNQFRKKAGLVTPRA